MKMKVCKCDRCGKIYSPVLKDDDFYSRVIQVSEETFGLTDVTGDVIESYDICDTCYSSFQDWIRRYNTTEAE